MVASYTMTVMYTLGVSNAVYEMRKKLKQVALNTKSGQEREGKKSTKRI